MTAVVVTADRAGLSFLAEAEGWYLLRRACPALAGAEPAVLLERTARLAGHFRYALDRSGVVLIGEVRDPDLATAASAEELPSGEAEPDVGEAVEAALEQTGFAWKRREVGWAVPADRVLAREIQVVPEAGGVRVRAVLTEWDEIGTDESAALAWFLCRAQAGLRFVRCELDGRQASVGARVRAGAIEELLPHCVGGAAAAVRALAREVGALLVPEIARAYRRLHGAARASTGAVPT